MAASIYTTSNTTTGVGMLSGGTIVATNTSGAYYDANRQTVYGIPAHDWQRMPNSERRYWAERYERELEYTRQQSMMMPMPPDIAEQKKVAVKTAPEPAFLNNKTLLLLEI